MKHFALIKNSIVENVIVVDDEAFIELIKDQFDEALEVPEGTVIGVGYIKDKEGTFIAPEAQNNTEV
jgi:hypothetical protein